MRTLVSEDDEAVGPAGDQEEPSATRATRVPWVPGWLLTVSLVGAVVAGVVLRLYSRSPLWLDEALSVNIARLPVGDLLEALRHDGHPPLYYLVLHYWMEAFGEGDTAVRLLSAVFGVAALPLAWIAGRRLGGLPGARWALALAALSPYCIRYSTETRMYSLVMLIVLGGYLVLTDALRAPTWLRLGTLTLLSGLLLLTHYWAFWLLAAVILLLAWRWRQMPDERAKTLRVTVAVVAGGVLFLPWLPGFLYQAAHTGTPWSGPVRPTMLLELTLQDLGGGEVAEGKLGGAVLLILCLVALFTVRSAGRAMVLDVRTAPTVRTELSVVALTMAVGCVMGYLSSSTYQARYAAMFVPLVLLAAAVGLTRIPGVAQAVAGAVTVALAIGGIAWVEYYQRTQSEPVAAAVAERANPGDVVVYCPDQLGPAFSREMPDGLVEVVYPTLEAPQLVDWVDYAERNGAADPVQIAAQIRSDHPGRGVFVVWRSQYVTFDQQCEQLVSALGEGGSTLPLISADEGAYYEPANMTWVPAVG
ncbi:MAG: glycosyltransferase family 39 protein [Acidimicrobiales bacterium]